MVKKHKRATTLDDLAAMVARGFENTATKGDIRRLENRIDRLEKKLEKLTETILNLKNKL